MLSFFFKKSKPIHNQSDFLVTDMHSHLLPGLDDGAEEMEESLNMLRKFVELGYKKAILTPHVMSDAYKNTPEGIREKLELLKTHARDIDVRIEAAAEYYVDEMLLSKLESNEEILFFGQHKYVLIETSYINESSYFAHVCFELQSKGYRPVLAHPERYIYLYNDFGKYEELCDRGLLLQLNISSLIGYYSPMSKKIAEKLIDNKMVHMVGTDCHSMKQVAVLEKAMQTSYFNKLRDLPLLNNTL